MVRIKVSLERNCNGGKSCLKDNHTDVAVISEAVVSLLLCLVRKCPSVCNVHHFLVFLGAYGATLSTTGKTRNASIMYFCGLFFPPLTSLFAFQIRNYCCFFANMKKTRSVCLNFSKFQSQVKHMTGALVVFKH